MGLDMYLYKKHYIGNKWKKPEEMLTINPAGSEGAYIKTERIQEITEQVAYWRKANQIHSWFVKNVQDNNDNCGDYFVSRKKLTELLDEVQLALKVRHLAPTILPTQSGFFFGDTEYNDYYWEDLKDTQKQLTSVLEEKGDGDFYYNSSW